MALPNVILNRPWILVTLSTSTQGINIAQAFGWNWGLVQNIYQTCDKCAAGDNILFEPAKAAKIVYGSTIYFLIEDTNSAFSEVPPV